jgi:hypothetical protein
MSQRTGNFWGDSLLKPRKISYDYSYFCSKYETYDQRQDKDRPRGDNKFYDPKLRWLRGLMLGF